MNTWLSPHSRCKTIGMVHLKTLFPFQKGLSIAEVERKALEDTKVLLDAGFDGIMVENFGDAPFFPDRVPSETVAGLTRIAHTLQNWIQSHSPKVKLGINVLRNDVLSALGIAAAVEAHFVRVNVLSGAVITDQGIMEGKAYEVFRTRERLHPECLVLSDIQVKHSAPIVLRPLVEEAEETFFRAKADALILSGTGTGKPTQTTDLKQVSEHLPDCPLLVGSGVTPETLPESLPFSSGMIIGSWIKKEGVLSHPVCEKRAKKIIRLLREIEV